MIYFIVGLLAFNGLIFCLASFKNKRDSQQGQSYISKTGEAVKVRQVKDNHYEGLRDMVLGLKPGDLQLSIPADQTRVYGVVMDWDLGDGVATFVSFATGDASMYVSSGGSLIGGGHHENVSMAAKAFVNRSQEFLSRAGKTETTPLPDKNCVRFYFLTNKGKFTAQENMRNFDNHSSSWLPLFEEGNKVISELRLTQEKKPGTL